MFMCVLGRLVASTIIIISTRTFRRALTASVDMLRGNKECPAFSGVKIWQSLEEGAGKRCSECGSVQGTKTIDRYF